MSCSPIGGSLWLIFTVSVEIFNNNLICHSLIAEQDGGSGRFGLPSLPKLSHEDLAEDDVAGVLEDGGEDDGDPVGLGLHVHRLVIAVVDDGLGLTLLASLLHNNLSEKRGDLKC